MILDNLGGPKNYDPNLYQKKREELLKILPTDQSQLPPRRMIDSYDSAIIPIASDPVLRVNIIKNDIFPVEKHLATLSSILGQIHCC